MIGFVRGIIHAFGLDFVLIDVNGIGYRINFYHPESLSIGKEITVYTYQNVREDEISLYGFLSLSEYDLFIRLISVKGLGPKIASGMLAKYAPERIVEAIEEEDTDFIQRLPGIGKKTASQIILDLKGKLVETVKSDDKGMEDLTAALKSMGYRQSEIIPVVNRLKTRNLGISEQLKEALRMLAK